MATELDFRVVAVNSEDDFEKIAPDLLVSNSWVSERHCKYPQHIILETRYLANVEKMQIVAHNHYIPQQIEIETSRLSLGTENFTKLGEVSFKEKKSSATKHELKSVFMDETLNRIHLIIHENYVNRESNPYNQTGLVNIKLLGNYIPDEPENYSFKYLDRPKSQKQEPDIDSAGIDTKYTQELKELAAILEANKTRAAKDENFKKAKEAQLAHRILKKAIKEMEELEKDKNDALQEEDFQRAQDLKDEMKTLRGSVLAAIDPRLLEEVPNDPQPSKHSDTQRPFSLYDLSASLPPPRLFEPISLSPRSMTPMSTRPKSHARLNSSDVFAPTPQEDRKFLNAASSPTRSPTPLPIGDVPNHLTHKPPAPTRSPIHHRSTSSKSRALSTASSTSSTRRRNSLDSPINIKRLPTAVESPNVSIRSRRPATRESYISESYTKPRSRASTNRFYEKENMIVPAALKQPRTPDRNANNKQDSKEEFLTYNAFLDAVHPSDRAIATKAIDKFGLTTTQKIYSKSYNQRIKGIQELKAYLEKNSEQGRDVSDLLDAVLPLLTRTLRDTLYAVYSNALELFEYIGVDFIPSNSLEKTGATKLASASSDHLISALGNSSVDNRFVAKTKDALSDAIGANPQFCKAFMKKFLVPFEAGATVRSDRQRALIVYANVKEFGPENTEAGFGHKPLGRFAVSAMKHSDTEVKNIGKKLFLMAYEEGDKAVLRKMLPQDISVSRNPRLRDLYTEMSKLDRSNYGNEREISALQTASEAKPLKSNLRLSSKEPTRPTTQKQTRFSDEYFF